MKPAGGFRAIAIYPNEIPSCKMFPTIEELRKMRKNLGISQKELAAVSGVSQSYIARLERGGLNPTYDKVKKIYEYLSKSSLRAEHIDIRAETVMSRSLLLCRPSDSVVKVLNTMRENGFSQLPVVSPDGRVVGTVTENVINDLLIGGSTLDSLKKLVTSNIMVAPLPIVDGSSPISMIYPLLKFHNAVLITVRGELKGILTKADILKAVELYG